MKRFIYTMVLAAAAATILVPAGFAQSGGPDDRFGQHGIGPSKAVSLGSDDRGFVRGSGPTPGVALGADDRPFGRGIGEQPVAVSPDDRAGARGVFETAVPAIVSAPVSALDDSFDLGDAGIGLGVGIALMLLAAAVIVTLRRARHPLAHS